MKSKPAYTRYAAVLLAAITAQQLNAADVIKANNTDALNLSTSWAGGSAPTSSDVGVWDNTVTGANATVLGADSSWSGIRIANPGGAVTINTGNTLTLGSGGIDASAATANLTIAAPISVGAIQTWNVGTSRTVTLSGGISGSSALTKSGAGLLLLSGASSGLSSNINVTAGTLQLGNSSAAGTGTITLQTGSTFNIASNSTTFSSNAVTVAAASQVNISSGNITGGYSGSITGDASSTITYISGNQVNMGAGGSLQQFANFLGTVEVAVGGTIRFSSTSGLNNGGANTTFNVLGTVTARNSGTVNLGALTGSGSITGSSGANGTTIYSIGGKGANSTYSGGISDATAGTRIAAVTKVGTGTQTFSGTVSYGGVTNVNAGTLFISGSKTGTGTVTVGASGTIGGTGSIAGATTVNGNLRSNTAPANNTDRLTFATSLVLAGASTTTFDIDGANFTGVTLSTTDTLTFGGSLAFNFVNSITPGTYDLFNFTDSNTGSFSSVNVTSVGALSFSSNVWSGIYGANSYSFSELTGDLTVSAIPEPSTWAAIAGVLGLGFAAWRRRRAA